jgi:hypothetical protein
VDNNAKHYQLAAAKIKAAASRPRFMGRFSIRVAKYFWDHYGIFGQCRLLYSKWD